MAHPGPGQMMMMCDPNAPRTVYVGLDLTTAPCLASVVQASRENGFNFLMVPLVHPRFRRAPWKDERNICSHRKEELPLTRADLALADMMTWSSSIVGKISSWLKLDSATQSLRRNSELAFHEEVRWAKHLSVHALLLPSPETADCANYARAVSEALNDVPLLQFWFPVSLSTKHEQVSEVGGCKPHPLQNATSWKQWNLVKQLCENKHNIGLALEIPRDLSLSSELLRRWLGEPIRAAILPTDAFATNADHCPELSPKHAAFLAQVVELTPYFVIRGQSFYPHGVVPFMMSLRHQFSLLPPRTEQEAFERGYRDFLQIPLQPLKNHLESVTYEVFEKDPVKYAKYQEAVELALRERHCEDDRVIVAVVGPGRGPLVHATLRAAKNAKRHVHVFAVEKNPNAIITLQSLKRNVWHDTVTVVSGDMRSWKAEVEVDILVSELLGSFADNELSPECLDGTTRFLKKTGISIPESSTSYLVPVSSTKLWNLIQTAQMKELKSFETPRVVNLHNFYQSASPQPCFSFLHPNRQNVVDNSRFTKLRFACTADHRVDALAGFFSAKLYKNIEISILPETYTKAMFSWFPILFPLRTPVFATSGQVIEVCMWRKVSASRVWYEWCLIAPFPTPLHNPNGRSYSIALSSS